MKNIKSLIVVAVLAVCATASAQSTETGYFTDGYLFRHEMNPAFDNERNYVSMPVVGNFNESMNCNTDLNSLFFSRNGKTVTFMNPAVTTDEFLGGIKDKNKFSNSLKMQLLGAGFKAWGGYNTIGITMNTTANINMPGELLKFAKCGVSNKSYDISGLQANVSAYMEVAVGHSRKINEDLKVGAKVKFLLGVADADANVSKGEVVLENNSWHITSNAEIRANMKGLAYKTTTTERGPEGEKTMHTYVNDFSVSNTGIGGFGLALDLGAEYKVMDDLKVSASVIDLGFISWSNTQLATTNGDRTFNTDKYIFNVDDKADNSFEKETDRLSEGLSAVYELQDAGNQGSRTKMLSATTNVGVEYTLPVYRPVTFGFLNTTRIMGKYTWTDFRLSANWKACRIFSMGTSAAYGTYGFSWGWIANFHTTGFNMFIASDHSLGKLAKPGIPLSGNAAFNIGINFPF